MEWLLFFYMEFEMDDSDLSVDAYFCFSRHNFHVSMFCACFFLFFILSLGAVPLTQAGHDCYHGLRDGRHGKLGPGKTRRRMLRMLKYNIFAHIIIHKLWWRLCAISLSLTHEHCPTKLAKCFTSVCTNQNRRSAAHVVIQPKKVEGARHLQYLVYSLFTTTTTMISPALASSSSS
jgi:hypothetical protein